MCGSLLSKFKKGSNKTDPETAISPEPREVKSQTKPADEHSACYEDRGFWLTGDSNADSSIHSVASLTSKVKISDCPNESYCSSQKESAMGALDCAKPVLPAINSSNIGLAPAERNSEHLLESAREILALQVYGVSSSSNNVAAHPLSSTLPKKKTAVAFDIPTGEENTVCPAARVPRCLRKGVRVAPQLTMEEVREKMRAAEERKLSELERIRECARSRAGKSRPHPAEVTAQATREKIAAKQTAAEIKRNKEIAKRREAGNRASRSRNRIAAARAFAKAQLESSIEQKTENTEKRKARQQQKIDKKNKLKEKYAKRVKDRVSSFYIIPNSTNVFRFQRASTSHSATATPI